MQGNNAKTELINIRWISKQCALMKQRFPLSQSITMRVVIQCWQWVNSPPYANVQYVWIHFQNIQITTRTITQIKLANKKYVFTRIWNVCLPILIFIHAHLQIFHLNVYVSFSLMIDGLKQYLVIESLYLM